MRKLLALLILTIGLLAGFSGVASAQSNSDSSTVTYTISAVTLVEIAGDVNLTIDSATSVGGGLASDSDSTTYAVTNNAGAKKLVGRLSATMPANTTLSVNAAAPAGGTSAGAVTMTDSNQNLVTGIGSVSQAGMNLGFTLSATINASLVNAGTKQLTLTLVDES
jgi:hypothetical protein